MIYGPEVAAEVTRLLHRDCLDEAEKKTGKSYKTDESTSLLGLVAHLEHTRSLNSILRAADDSAHGISIEDYTSILEAEGFHLVLREEFEGNSALETLQIWWNPADGLLLRFDSYNGATVNSANVYYNWIPNEGVERCRFTSSGGFYGEMDAGRVWVGDHDAREAIRLKLQNLRSNGRFLPEWRYRPFLWLVNYSEQQHGEEDWQERSAKYDRINAERLSRLPETVRMAIGGEAGNDAR